MRSPSSTARDLYEHMDPRQGEQQDWGTLIFNFGRNEVRNFLIGNALFWLDKYHIDGLRVDAVASMLYLDYSRKPGQWIPNVYGGRENLEAIYFLKRFNEVCYEQFPGIITIAEESTAWPGVTRPTYLGGLGFGFKWNMGWMHDFLHYMSIDPIYRRFHHEQHHVLAPLRVPGKFHPRAQPRRSRARQALVVIENAGRRMAEVRQSPDVSRVDVRASGQKAAFHGRRIRPVGTNGTTTRSFDWQLLELPRHDGLRRLVQHLNHVYKNEPALWQLDDTYDGFEWIDFHDADNSVVSFLRRSRDGDIVVIRGERDAGGALQLSARRSRIRLLSRDHQHRRRNLRRQQRRQPWRRAERSSRVDGPRTFHPDSFAAFGDRRF